MLCHRGAPRRSVLFQLQYGLFELHSIATDLFAWLLLGTGRIGIQWTQVECSQITDKLMCFFNWEQSNAVTSFLDQSNIYGSEPNAAESVRLFSRGKLRLENDIMALTPNCTGPFCYFTGKSGGFYINSYLNLNKSCVPKCSQKTSISINFSFGKCIGDNRGSFYPTLGLWHSIFIRFHNNIADQLSLLNPHWDEEKCFQETRRILTAVYQNIVYNEWLPYYIGKTIYDCTIIIERRNNNCFQTGKEAAERRNLSCSPDSGYCGRYDADVDPSNMNEFAHGAFRLFHANTPENVNFYNAGKNINVTQWGNIFEEFLFSYRIREDGIGTFVQYDQWRQYFGNKLWCHITWFTFGSSLFRQISR